MRAAASSDNVRLGHVPPGIDLDDIKRKGEARGEGPAERHVGRGLVGPQAVVDVDHASERPVSVLRQFGEQQEQGDRVRAAGHCDGDAVAGGQQAPDRIARTRRRARVDNMDGIEQDEDGRSFSPQPSSSTRKWCRYRDLNPGPCGYEPHALTN